MKDCLNNIYKRIEELGLKLPEPPKDTPTIKMVKPFGNNLVYVSGMGSDIEGSPSSSGKIPRDVSVESGMEAARNSVLNALASLDLYISDLNKIKNFVKLLVFVASDSDFTEQHIVANGASQVLIDIFGEEIGKAARSAIGVASLPKNFPVEVEMLVEI